MSRHLALLVLVIQFSSTVALSQQGAPERFRLAQTYEQSGDPRSAARIYQELYAERPQENKYFHGVVRTLSQLGQHASLVPLVEEKMKASPSVDIAILLGTAQWKSGMSASATDSWNKAIELASNNETTLVAIGEAQIGAGAHALALRTIERARDIASSPATHAFLLARLYLATGDLMKATESLLIDYNDNNDLMQTQGQLAAVMARDGGVQILRQQLGGSSPEMLRLRMWFHQELKEWTLAMNIAKDLDDKLRAQGQELFMFGERARRDGQLEVAVDVFGLVAEMSSSADQWRQNSLYWYVRTLDQRIRSGSQISPTDAKVIIDRYLDVVKRFPNTWFAADALYHCGVLYDDVLNERERARELLQRVANSWRGTVAASDAVLYLADFAIAEDRLGVALQILQSIDQQTTTAELTARRDMAAVIRADILAWSGQIDTATSLYMQIAQRTGSAASNDAFDRILFLQMVDTDTATRSAALLGDRELRSRRYSQAAILYESASQTAKEPELRDRCRWQAAQAWWKLRNDIEVDRVLSSLVKEVPESIYGDRALFLWATILERRGDPVGAISALTNLLTFYPRSILSSDARERIRRLRGDA